MNKSIILFCACFVGSCSSTRPNDVGVDEEALAIDLDACIANPAGCKMNDKATPIDYVVPGTHAVFLQPGGTITAPLEFPPNAKKLIYLVVANGSPGSGSTLDVTVGSFPVQRVSPAPGTNRLEVAIQTPSDARDVESAKGDTVTIANESTSAAPFVVIWVVGRWAD